MDVVYVVRKGDKNPELRSSLRSVAANLKHDCVWMVGYRPRWVDPAAVTLIPTNQVFSKFRVVPTNVVAACREPEISDPFILLHDDMFVMQPTEAIPVCHRGPIAEGIAENTSWAKVYVEGLQRAIRLLGIWGYPEPVSYELHMPLVIDKGAFLHMWARAAFTVKDMNTPTCSRTLYGNLAELGGPQIEDVKIHDVNTLPPEDATFVSTNDGPYVKGRAGEWLRKRLPVPCRYERPVSDG